MLMRWALKHTRLLSSPLWTLTNEHNPFLQEIHSTSFPQRRDSTCETPAGRSTEVSDFDQHTGVVVNAWNGSCSTRVVHLFCLHRVRRRTSALFTAATWRRRWRTWTSRWPSEHWRWRSWRRRSYYWINSWRDLQLQSSFVFFTLKEKTPTSVSAPSPDIKNCSVSKREVKVNQPSHSCRSACISQSDHCS